MIFPLRARKRFNKNDAVGLRDRPHFVRHVGPQFIDKLVAFLDAGLQDPHRCESRCL